MSKNIFNSVPVKAPKRSHFDLSNDFKFSLDMGNLVPVCWYDCLPGDSFNISCSTLLRFAPLVAPVMHRFNVYVHYFFVPRRLLWNNWEAWITQQADDSGFIHPFITWATSNSRTSHKLADYLGLLCDDTVINSSYNVDAMPFAAYQMIYQEYYRDENLISKLWNDQVYPLGDGDNTSLYNAIFGPMRKRAWTHDYFTSSLPFAQKGTAVALPIDLEDLKVYANASSGLYSTLTGSPNNIAVPGTPTDNTNVGAGGLFAQGGSVTSSTIDDFNRAYKLQKWLQLNARAGNRYTESVRANFGVTPADARLQRPEYITGMKTPVIVSEVLNTNGSFDSATGDPTSPVQGSMSGHAISSGSGHYGKFFCQEHGIIMGIMSVMPEPTYQQGIHRAWMKNDPVEDYAWPLFANIGEQPVHYAELMAAHSHLVDEPYGPTWGYVPRYAEYKYMPSRVAGDFKTSLDFWHDGRIFDASAPPSLNQSFIECTPDKRIFAVEDPDVDSLYCHHFNNVQVTRALPKYGVPNLM